MLITPPVWYVVKCILWKPNILPLFNLGWWYLWSLQHSVAAVLLFAKQPHNIIWFDIALQKFLWQQHYRKFSRQLHHLPQCSYGLGYDIYPTQCCFDERCGDELSAFVRSELQTAYVPSSRTYSTWLFWKDIPTSCAERNTVDKTSNNCYVSRP